MLGTTLYSTWLEEWASILLFSLAPPLHMRFSSAILSWAFVSNIVVASRVFLDLVHQARAFDLRVRLQSDVEMFRSHLLNQLAALETARHSLVS